MKLNRFVRSQIFRNNTPEPTPAHAGEPAPSTDEGAGGGESDSISTIAGLIAETDEPAEPTTPEADPAPEPDAPAEPEPASTEPADELSKLRARIAELEDKQAKPETETKPAASTFLKAASEATTPEQLAAHEDYCEKMRAWALENWDGATITGDDGNSIEFTAAQVRQQFTRFDNELRKAIPAQAAALEQRAAAAEQRKSVEAEAAKAYPWISQPDSEDGKLYAKFMGALPSIAELPAGPMAIADMIAGFRARTRKASAPAVSPAPRTTPRPPAVPKPAAGGTGPATFDAAKALDLIRSRGGDRKSVADALLAGGLVK